MECRNCRCHLDGYDIGCYKKMVNRGATEFLCRNCLADELGCAREELERLILRFREQGCTLFPPL